MEDEWNITVPGINDNKKEHAKHEMKETKREEKEEHNEFGGVF
jgi:hypothetical protein